MNTNPPLSPQPRIVTATEDDGDLDLDALLIDDSLSTSQDPALVSTASWSPRPHIPIKAIEEDIDAGGDNSEWVLPPPSQPGDFLTNSIHRVPSKSILKKVSSYGNFDMNESISSSKRGNSMKKKQSFLSFDVSVNSGVASASAQSKNGSDYGLDLDSSSNSQISTSFLLVPSNFQVSVAPVQPVDTVKDSTAPADAAAGTLDTSLGSSKLSTSGKMRRNVSFNAVSVREYDRTIGDNPACKSGPPLSLDWSYSKASSKSVDDFELERSSQRVSHPARLRVNKYRRRNMLSFHWGHSQDEMKQARSETKKLQRQRSITQALLPVHMAHEVCLSIKKMVTKKGNEGLSGDDMSELSLSASKHAESISNSRHSGTSNRQTLVAESPVSTDKFHADNLVDDT